MVTDGVKEEEGQGEAEFVAVPVVMEDTVGGLVKDPPHPGFVSLKEGPQ